MTLRTKTLMIDRTVNGVPSRDNGGIFTLEEMAAEPAADWFMRAMQFLVRAGMDVPPNIFAAGPAGFFAIGIGTALTGLSKAPWFEVKPLLAELLTQVKTYQPPGAGIPSRGWPVIRTQIQEPMTIFALYEEVVSLSLGFSLADRLLSFRSQVTSMMAEFTPNTETSMPGSESSSDRNLPN
jgi:hypothetical protein